MAERDVRICVIGDELVIGVGDARGIGWLGRVISRTPQRDIRLSAFPLAVPRETTTALAARWQSEAALRWRGPDEGPQAGAVEPRLVIGLGMADLRHRTTTARSRLNLANILDAADVAGVETLVIGPPPVAPRGPDGGHGDAVGELSAAFADVCHRRRVGFVDTWTPLSTHDDWFADFTEGDGRYPGQAGYGLLAWLVLHAGWNEWLGVDAD